MILFQEEQFFTYDHVYTKIYNIISNRNKNNNNK